MQLSFSLQNLNFRDVPRSQSIMEGAVPSISPIFCMKVCFSLSFSQYDSEQYESDQRHTS